MALEPAAAAAAQYRDQKLKELGYQPPGPAPEMDYSRFNDPVYRKQFEQDYKNWQERQNDFSRNVAQDVADGLKNLKIPDLFNPSKLPKPQNPNAPELSLDLDFGYYEVVGSAKSTYWDFPNWKGTSSTSPIRSTFNAPIKPLGATWTITNGSGRWGNKSYSTKTIGFSLRYMSLNGQIGNPSLGGASGVTIEETPELTLSIVPVGRDPIPVQPPSLDPFPDYASDPFTFAPSPSPSAPPQKSPSPLPTKDPSRYPTIDPKLDPSIPAPSPNRDPSTPPISAPSPVPRPAPAPTNQPKTNDNPTYQPVPSPNSNPGGGASLPDVTPSPERCKDPCIQKLHDKLDKKDDSSDCCDTVRIVVKRFKSCTKTIDGQVVDTIDFDLIPVAVPKLESEAYQLLYDRIFALESAQCTKHDCESYAAIPDWWQIRLGSDVPQLVVQYAEVLKDGKFGAPKYVLTIPHYNKSKDATSKGLFPSYWKGQRMGILTLNDNSKLIVNAKTESEVERVINQLRGTIGGNFLQGSVISTGQRKGAQLKQIEVAPRFAKYFSKGQQDVKPDWVKEFK
jgi:hypothetical protein